MEKQQSIIGKNRLVGGILLVAGTTIGAGMLALPITTGNGGFYPSLVLIIGYWLVSLFSALLVLEVNLRFDQPVNLITMSRRTLGRAGECVAWVTYLMLLYSLTAAYLSGIGAQLAAAFAFFAHITLPVWVEPIPFLALFCVLVILGTKSVDYCNRCFMIGLGVAYFLLVVWVAPHIEQDLLMHFHPAALIWAVPVIATSFGFHIVIPTLTTYLGRNVKQLRQAIWIGSAIALVVYILWEFVILGVLPLDGPYGITQALADGEAATQPLAGLLHEGKIALFAQLFAFCAIVTSFLGVGLSLSHFLTDGLKLATSGSGRVMNLTLTFLPPLCFVLWYPRGFILALDYAGVAVAILLGILPVLMAWRSRKLMPQEGAYQVRGGNVALLLALLCFLAIACVGILQSGGMK